MQKKIEFCWVPSHIGIHMNEIADREAKSAIRDRRITPKTIPFSDYYPTIENKIKDKWQTDWTATALTNKLRNIKCTVNKWKSSFQKHRRWEVVLARLS